MKCIQINEINVKNKQITNAHSHKLWIITDYVPQATLLGKPKNSTWDKKHERRLVYYEDIGVIACVIVNLIFGLEFLHSKQNTKQNHLPGNFLGAAQVRLNYGTGWRDFHAYCKCKWTVVILSYNPLPSWFHSNKEAGKKLPENLLLRKTELWKTREGMATIWIS